MIEKPEKPPVIGKTRILILGAGLMQGPALQIAAEMGLETVAADINPGAVCVPMAKRFEKVDLKDKDGILTLARTLMEQGGLGGIMTAGTDFTPSVAWAAEKLGLSGLDFETALDASDKERMRRRFKAAGLSSPEFVIFDKLPEKNFQLPFSWPAVVKPVDNMGSRGCRRVDSSEELETAVSEALKFSRSGRVIVEQYMDGPEFSVDALVYQGEIIICGLADRHIFFPPYFIEMGHTIPSSLDPETTRNLLETFKRGVKALGINNGAAKGDIKLTKQGPAIGEIAARLSGGYMSGWTFPYSSGVLPTKGAIEIALGKKPAKLEPQWNWVCAERAFISIPGKVRSIQGVEFAKIRPWVKNVFLNIRQGSQVSFPENNVSKCGNILSAAAERYDAISSAETAARSILIRLEAPNKETKDFLSVNPGKERFPPDAFPLDEQLLSTLKSLPDPFESPIPPCPPCSPCFPPCLLDLRVLNFPQFLDSGLTDYVGRSVQETLDAVRTLTGLDLPIADNAAENDEKKAFLLGRSFWQALIRGGYQGAVYYIDLLRGEND